MRAERAPGSDRGRPAIDWEQAFQFYASLPDPQRNYQAVATKFGVSVRTVEKHGRIEGWKQRLARVHTEAATHADARLGEQRAEKLAEVELLIDATMTTYAHQLRSGSVRVAPVDLQRLFKLREELWAQEAAQNGARRAAQAAASAATEADGETRMVELVRALHDAGAFERLRNLLSPTTDPAELTSEDEPKAASDTVEEAA